MAYNNNKDQHSFAQAKTAVFRYLKYRPRSEQEIIHKLKDKGFPADIIDTTIDYLKKTGLINDEQFAKGWARSRLNKPIGIRRIQLELRQKGIADDLIMLALNETTDDYKERDAVLRLAKRRWSKYQHLDQDKAKRRLYEFLCRRGFNVSTILTVINTIT